MIMLMFVISELVVESEKRAAAHGSRQTMKFAEARIAARHQCG